MDTVSVRGVEVPTLGLGTWQTTGDQCYETVSTALELGYRHVDTAQLYENERAVGRAIADSDVDREDVWLTTKVTPGNARYEDVLASSRESLERLDTSYVDLLLLHWPNPLVDFGDTARAMAELRDDGLVDNVGVSNFRRWRLRKARKRSPVPILADQVRCHPYYTRETLRNECEREEQVLTAYSPLAHGGVVDDSRPPRRQPRSPGLRTGRRGDGPGGFPLARADDVAVSQKRDGSLTGRRVPGERRVVYLSGFDSPKRMVTPRNSRRPSDRSRLRGARRRTR